MSDDEQAAGAHGKTVSYPRKYWWVVLVFLPIALTLIKVVPDLMKKDGSSSSGGFVNKQDGNNNVAINGSNNVLSTDLSTKTYVINMAAIEKEYAATKNESLGEDLKKQIAAAIALLEAGKPGESAAAFEKINQQVSLPSLQTDLGVAYQQAGNGTAATKTFTGILTHDPNYAAAHHNLGLVKAAAGELVEAKQHFDKAGDVGESKALSRAINQELQVHDFELEPNNKADQANILPLEKTVLANIAENGDVDYFRFTTPAKYRDIVEVSIRNQSTTLQPSVNIYDATKSALHGNWNPTAAADLTHAFSVTPETVYFAAVAGANGTTGRYTITVKPLKKYDAFEPNPDILSAATIEIGKEISANIMDDGDKDFYRFKTKPAAGTARVHIENTSSTLQPSLAVFDPNKSGLPGNWNPTPGANLDHNFKVEANAFYSVSVAGANGSSGSYTLTITQE